MTEPTLHTPEESTADDELALWPSPGEKVRKMREDLGYSVEKVAESLYITAHYVKALEKNEFDKLPSLTFVKGYYKAYATFLGADVDELVSCFVNYKKAFEARDEQEAIARESENKSQLLIWMSISGVIVILAIALVFWLIA